MGPTYEELMAKSKEMTAAGRLDDARRLAELALKAKRQSEERPTEGPWAGHQFASADGVFNPWTGQTMTREQMVQTIFENNARTDGELSRGKSGASGAVQGLTFGGYDELLGAAMWALPGPGTRKERQLFAQEAARAQMEAAKQSNPNTFMASEIGGSVVPALAGGSAALGGKALTGGAKRLAARGAATGATEGAIYGGLTGEGLEGRQQAAINNAKIGAAAGAIAPGVSWAGKKALGLVANPVIGAADAMLNRANNTKANRAIANALMRSGKEASELTDDITRAAAEGQPEYMLADALGNPGQRMLSGVARQPGAYRTDIAEALQRRQAMQGGRVGSFLSEAFEAPDTAAQRTAALTTARNEAADVAYDAARGNAAPVEVRGALDVIDARLGNMPGSGVDGDSIDGLLTRFRKRLSAPNPQASQVGLMDVATDGVPPASSVTLSDFNRVLGVKQDVGDAISRAARAGEGNKVRELKKLLKALDSALEDASPAYRAANDEFAAASRVIGAVDEGRAATSTRRRHQDIMEQYQAMTPDEQAAFKAGYADPLIAKVDSSAPGVNKVRPILDDKSAAELSTMADDGGLLERRLAREDTMFETRRQAIGGSQTADNAADMAEVGGMSGTLLQAGADLARGNPVNAGVNALAGAARHVLPYATGKNEATRAEIARILMSRDPQNHVMRALSQAQSDATKRLIADALMRSSTLRIGG